MGVKSTVLFKLPIESNGSVVVTQPAEKVYLLTFTSPPDNRLVTSFCQAIILALDIIELRYEPGVVITTSGIEKFYSNGLNLEHASSTPGFFTDSLYALWLRLLTFPMPTVALINGHAFAGALMTAMMQDYRIMNPHKGYLCLNELELGVPLRPPMSSIFREKCTPTAYRKLVLEAARFKALDALKEGIVDHLGGLAETLAFVEELQLVKRVGPGMSGINATGPLKREMYGITVGLLENWGAEAPRDLAVEQAHQKDSELREKKVAAWESKKSKL
ncbi:hypothetical protein AMS68_004228 [Peltaster fructicola]|uniref:Enoyl-CoA hydratase n=1 Tax=Peltaster fructicola TaxID=286661 RepID=A0A6H0XVM7_9PEZI|nr:hypothetical protein AMS68_004228 [Peltaster fructicola]